MWAVLGSSMFAHGSRHGRSPAPLGFVPWINDRDRRFVVIAAMIMINLLHELGNEETLTPEKVQKVIQCADTEKLTTAVERLRDNEARRNS